MKESKGSSKSAFKELEIELSESERTILHTLGITPHDIVTGHDPLIPATIPLPSRLERVAIGIALNHSDREIAVSIGASPGIVANHRMRDDVQRRVNQIRLGMGAIIKKRIEGLIPESIETVAALMRDAGISPAVRKDIAFGLMDRHMGKPTQPIEEKGTALRELLTKINRSTIPAPEGDTQEETTAPEGESIQ